MLICARSFHRSHDLQGRYTSDKRGITLLETGVHLCGIVPTTSSRRIRRAQFGKIHEHNSAYIYIYIYMCVCVHNCVHGSRSLENTLSESSITTTRSTVLTQSALIEGELRQPVAPSETLYPRYVDRFRADGSDTKRQYVRPTTARRTATVLPTCNV
jgi:hypothetical protein